MSYLLDKKIKRKKISHVVFFVIVFLVLFYFRLNIWNGLSYASAIIFRPVFVVGNNIKGKLSNTGAYFYSKKSLLLENEDLKSKLDSAETRMANYDSILDENESLKEIFGRKDEKTPMILASILSKPNKSPYDTIVIDAGQKQGFKEGDVVFALGNIPIGRISIVYPNSSKVVLFSNSGDKTQIIIPDQNVFMEVVGRGGGNFEMIVPLDFILEKGDKVVLPGITPYVLAVVEAIISDPRDPFVKALLVSPVNIQELKFVQVEKQK